MGLILGSLFFIVGLVISVFKDIYLGYSLTLSLIVFILVALQMEKTPKEIGRSIHNGVRKSYIVMKIFLLIGMVTASWLAAGTIPSIVYYSLEIINPKYFVVFAFLISSLISYMLGTSFGTVSTIGIVLMIMARAGDINLHLVGGAILSGCYFGDRTSPMSSSANIVATLTGSELYTMLKDFRRTTYIPFTLTVILYLVFSVFNPLDMSGNMMGSEIQNYFIINFIILIPAIAMLGLSVLRVDVQKAMGISIVLSVGIALFIQQVPFINLLKYLVFGFKLETSEAIGEILKGGGLLSMAGSGYVIFISCGLIGVFEEVHIFDKIHSFLSDKVNNNNIMFLTAGTALVTAMIGGNQVISIIMTIQIMRDLYKKQGFSNYKLATDISNTAILFAGFIPWNIGSLVPATAMELDPIDIIPYSFYLFLPFIINVIVDFKNQKQI